MDDSRLADAPAKAGRGSAPGRSAPARRNAVRWSGFACAVAIAAIVTGASGCSLFVMAGKMVFGDPLTVCEFTETTHVDLVKDDQRVVLLCTIPEFVRNDFPSLDTDLIDAMSIQLRRRRVDVVRQDQVEDWIEEQGGLIGEPHELATRAARDLDADYILHVNVQGFSLGEENSERMFRGRVAAGVTAYAVAEVAGAHQALQVFVTRFASVYPAHHPITTESMSARSFQKRCVDHVGLQLAQLFFNHRVAEEIE